MSFAALRNGRDFALFVRVLVMAMDGLNLIHLNGLGNSDTDFRSPLFVTP